eukprot:CAMPEP_0194445100 /NCGR_PEP_ID=MMETSP0176-20130528/127665_1 /TAXON_ID=216777 /ORGANISM="Proboscia alata, Strain PI-D3" /LENGTH=99 /DNA_ID=CAMNT_0039271601 /DNA_START=1722 /DNA_END=2018 /DNA_ORIENTATION=+
MSSSSVRSRGKSRPLAATPPPPVSSAAPPHKAPLRRIVASTVSHGETPAACAATAMAPAEDPASGVADVRYPCSSNDDRTPMCHGNRSPPGDKEKPILI